MAELHETFSRSYVTGEEDEDAVADYWDSLTGGMTRVTPGIDDSYKFAVPLDEECHGDIAAPTDTANNRTKIEISVDPNSQSIRTEYWRLGFSSLGVDTILGE